jgi:hypothetical protein
MLLAGAALRFFLAAAALLYLPGRLVLRSLDEKLSRLERLVLASLLGAVASSGVFALAVRSGHRSLFILWPAAVAMAWLATQGWKSRAAPRTRCRTAHLALAGIFLLGVATFAYLPQYFSNLTASADGGMRAQPIDDVFFHLAISRELAHSIPPQNPLFSGYPLSYHVGSDLATAMLATAAGVGLPDAALRLMPVLIWALAILAVFCFARRWLGSSNLAALATFLVLFGEDFSFLPGLIRDPGGTTDWSARFFAVPTVFSLFYTNPMPAGLALLFAGWLGLLIFLREGRRTAVVLAAVFFSALIEVKLFPAVQTIVSLGAAGAVHLIWFRQPRLLKAAALTLILSLPACLAIWTLNRSGGQFELHFSRWSLITGSLAELFPAGTAPTGFVALLVGFPLFLIGAFGLRILAAPGLYRAIRHPDPRDEVRSAGAVFVLSGIMASLLFRLIPKGAPSGYDNAAWFMVQSKYVVWVFALETFRDGYRWLKEQPLSRRFARPVAVAAALVLSLPSTVEHLRLQHAADRRSFNPAQVAAARFVAASVHPGEVVLCGPELLAPVLALGDCRVPLGPYAETTEPLAIYERRVAQLDAFWRDWRAGRIRWDLLRELRIDLIATKRPARPLPSTPAGSLATVFADGTFSVFQVPPGSSTIR